MLSPPGDAMTVYETARAKMIDCQLRPNKVTDERIIDAFARIRRELFVPEHLRGVAYVDEDLPLGKGRYLMEPMVAARLLQAAMPDRKDTALVVGANVGYEAALLALLARSVVALEEDAELARLGRAALVDHRIASVRVCADADPAANSAADAIARVAPARSDRCFWHPLGCGIDPLKTQKLASEQNPEVAVSPRRR